MVFTGPTFTIIGVIFIIFTVITFVFSAVTILTIVLNWKSQFRSITNLLTCNSSAALLFYVIGISIQIPFIFQDDRNQGSLIFCQIRAFIYVFACAVKSLSYLVHAISRWFITVHYKHRILLRLRTNMFIVLASWMISLIISLCLLISSKAYQYEPESRLCVLTSKVFLTSFVAAFITFFIPACTIFLLYGSIIWHTTHVHRVHPNGVTNIANKRNISVYRNVLILLAIVLTCGTPYFISIIINGITEGPWMLYPIAVIFIALAAAMESLAIFFTNQEVKKAFYKKICSRQKRQIAVIT